MLEIKVTDECADVKFHGNLPELMVDLAIAIKSLRDKFDGLELLFFDFNLYEILPFFVTADLDDLEEFARTFEKDLDEPTFKTSSDTRIMSKEVSDWLMAKKNENKRK